MKTVNKPFILILAFVMLINRWAIAQSDTAESKLDMMPLISYDTDAGLGYGGKLFFLNYFRANESFDITLFNSTKGERWYRVVFSMPDFELRQGTVYPWALDIIIDYDKYLKANFFGAGSTAKFADREYYSKAPLEASAIISRAFTRIFVVQAGIQFCSITNSNFDPRGKIYSLVNSISAGTFRYTALLFDAGYDSRNSYVNPSAGIALHLSLKCSPWNASSLLNAGVNCGYYTRLFNSAVILATRAALQSVSGKDLPLQALITSGGNRTLRGYVLDRYLSKVQCLVNTELRFPIYNRLGGAAGIDIARPADSFRQLDFKNWAGNLVMGLRYYFDTFILRVDMGIGPESTGLYINFGQAF